MVLSDLDRSLLRRCLAREPRSWEDFVDRFLGLVLHVVDHAAHCRAIPLTREDREDLTSEVFLAVLQNDLAVLRRFRGHSSLATYLTVIARRVVVRHLLHRPASPWGAPRLDGSQADPASAPHQMIADEPRPTATERMDLERLLEMLNPDEADVVRLFHLEGKSYRDISRLTGMPENSVGPTLSRARGKMQAAAGQDLSHT